MQPKRQTSPQTNSCHVYAKNSPAKLAAARMMEEETVLKDAIAEQRNLYLNSTAEFEALFERLQEQIGHLESEIENRAALTNPSVTLLNEAVKTATEGLTRAKRATEGAGVADADVRAMKVLMGLGPAKRRTVRGI